MDVAVGWMGGGVVECEVVGVKNGVICLITQGRC